MRSRSERHNRAHGQRKKCRGIAEQLAGQSIVLVGMMGAGKSAIGRRLAVKLGLNFTDADAEIEKAAGKSIGEIFEENGETDFRHGERRVIARLLTAGPQVLATGGGAYMDAETRLVVAGNAVSVWLRAELEVLLSRVKRRDSRPLLKGKDAHTVLTQLIEQRYPTYALADITVESRNVVHDIVVDEIIAALDRHLCHRTNKECQ